MSTLVVGLGNRDRGDDALGLVVADRLAVLGLDADVVAWERPELDLLEVLPAHDRVVVVDAVRSGAPPGTLFDEVTSLPTVAPGGSHGFGLAGVLELAATLGRLPARVDLRLVEAEAFDHGTGLSPAVAAAVDVLLGRLAHELAGGVDVPR